jgi:hypothetical protein
MFIKENCIIKKIKYVEEKFQRNFPRVINKKIFFVWEKKKKNNFQK